MDLDKVIAHCRRRDYMSGIVRDRSRLLQTQEVFTPTDAVIEDLDEWPQQIFANPKEVFIDNACGDGQFLSEVLIRKLQNGISFEDALKSLRGVDLQMDNVILCRERLLCGQDHLRSIVEQNIICGDALKYHYRFDGTDPTETMQSQLFRSLFDVSD